MRLKLKAFKVVWQTFQSGDPYLNVSTRIINKEDYFITQDAALEFIEVKDKALRELGLNLGQLYMPTLHEVELK